MAKQIIILNRLNEPSDLSFRYVLWAPVPSTRVSTYADATATSAWAGASAAELTAIQAGQVEEKVATAYFPAGTPIAQVEAFLVARYTEFAAQIASANPDVRKGSFYDGVSWTLAGTS